MYVEERRYRLKVGAVPEYCKHYQELGMQVQLKHLPHMLGYYHEGGAVLRRASQENARSG